MTPNISFERCRSYIGCQLESQEQPVFVRRTVQSGPAITISRQTGSGARSVAERLMAYLQANEPKGGCPWTVFDRQLVEKVCEEHNLPKEFAQFMTEDRRSYLDDAMEELLGLHPPTWTLVHQTTQTILHLAEMGHVILVGRGATVITAKMPQVFHVRLIGSLERRIPQVQKFYGMSAKEAVRFIRKEDRGRSRYLKKHFGADLEEPLLYHLVINTDRIAYEEAARLIGDAALRYFKACAEAGTV